jgi:hypothetical protein
MPSGNAKICELTTSSFGEEDPTATLVRAQELAIKSMPIVPLVNRVDVVGSRVPAEVFGPVANTPWLVVATTESMGN